MVDAFTAQLVAQLHALLDNPNVFKTWLEGLPEGADAGVQREANYCPVATFLRNQTGNKHCVTHDAIDIYYTTEVSGMPFTIWTMAPTPEWVRRFVKFIDDPSWTVTPTGVITVRQALDALAETRRI